MSEIVLKRYHPGEFLADSLEAMRMSAKEFSLRTGISERTLSDLLNKKGNITFDIAYKLSQFFNNEINFWTNLQNSYDEYLFLEATKTETKEDYKLLKSKINYLKELNIINDEDDELSIVSKTRNALGVNRISSLNGFNALYQGSFKLEQNEEKDHSFERNFFVSLALMEARKKYILEFDKAKLESLIPLFKSYTTKDPEYFYPRLIDKLAECGVAFVALPYLNKSDVYGVTKWLTSDKVMLAISDRLKRADMFWFIFFHELEHVLFEHKRKVLFQTKEEYITNIEEEHLANELAGEILIPKKDWNEFINDGNINSYSIKKFAKKCGVAPFIVLGRLYKENIIPQGTYFNELMVKYHIVYKL